MIIATFNANSIRSRLQIIIDWLEKNQPDILCIQETKAQDKDFPAEKLLETGYSIAFKGQKSYNGVAIISKKKPENIDFGFDCNFNNEARFISAEFENFKVVNTYIPQGYEVASEKFQYKIKWFAALKQHFVKNFKMNEKIIWTGDFNVARDHRDVHDPEKLWGHVCYCKPAQDAFENVASLGFIDLFRKFNEKPDQYTFWDYRLNSFKRNKGWRIDYIMATENAAENCKKCWIDKEPRQKQKPSDHTFLAAEFDFNT